MNVDHGWTFKLIVIAVLCLLLRADNDCEIKIDVHRDTVYVASLGQQLKIACPVTVCDSVLPTIHWFKVETEFIKVNISDRITTEREKIKQDEARYFLIFNNVLRSDSGQYRCRHGYEESHTINLTVTDIDVNINGTSQDNTNKTSSNHDNNKQLWLYLYTAGGIVGFVTIVIVISVLSMRGCNGQPKDRTPGENQYMDIPIVEMPVRQSSNQALPSASPCGTPSYRNSKKNKSPCTSTQRGNVYDPREGQSICPEEEGSSVVYAALNHQHLAGVSPRPRTVVDERSEYSAIRIS